MSEKVITADEVLGALLQAVNDKGRDYRYKDEYSTCVNFDVNDVTGKREPRCIAGHAYETLGVDQLVSDHGSYGISLREMVDHGAVKIEPSGIRALAVAQEIQDSGGTWGIAYTAAAAVVEADRDIVRMLGY